MSISVDSVDRAERLLSAYDAGFRLASRLRGQASSDLLQEKARQAGFVNHEEMNCFMAAFHNHSR